MASRLAQAIPATVIAVTVVFFSIRLLPGDELTNLVGEQAMTAEDREALREQLGLNHPLPAQYWDFVSGLITGDLGTGTFDDQPVLDKVADRLPVTVELALLSTLISLAIAIPLGIASALSRNSVIDYVIRFFGILTLSVPSFWLATMSLVVGAIYFNWVPSITQTSFIENPFANLKQFLLPSILLGAALAGSVMRITRSMMLEVLGEDYIRTAWSKGLRLRAVVARHAVRNALIPVITVIGLQMASLLGGTVVIESIFGLPGLGSLIVSSLARRDYPVIQGINVLIVLTVIVINLLIDLSYVLIDPRVRYD